MVVLAVNKGGAIAATESDPEEYLEEYLAGKIIALDSIDGIYQRLPKDDLEKKVNETFEQNTGNRFAKFAKATILQKSGELEQALSLFEEIRPEGTFDYSTLSKRKFDCQYKLGNFEAAFNIADDMLGKASEDQDYIDALRLFMRFKLEDVDEKVLFEKVKECYRITKNNVISDVFKTAIKHDSNNWIAHYLLAHEDINYGFIDNAAENLTKARKLNPKLKIKFAYLNDSDEPETQNRVGRVYLQSGSYDEAAVVFKQIVGKNPALDGCWGNLITALTKDEKYDKAIEEANTALEHNEKNGYIYAKLAFVYLERRDSEKNDLEEAVKNYKISIDLLRKSKESCPFGEAYYNLACTLSLMHRGFKRPLKSAIKINSGYAEIARNDEDFKRYQKKDWFIKLTEPESNSK